MKLCHVWPALACFTCALAHAQVATEFSAGIRAGSGPDDITAGSDDAASAPPNITVVAAAQAPAPLLPLSLLVVPALMLIGGVVVQLRLRK